MKALMVSVLMATVLGARADAITVVPMTFEQLVEAATTVVYARVADVRGQWTADRRSIDSVVTLEALRYLKGESGTSVLMRLPGGTAGGVINVMPGAPVVREGELLVVFLQQRGPAVVGPLGLGQGLFRVVRDVRSGAMLVSPPPLKASVAGRVLRGAADRRVLSVDQFEASIRAVEAAQ